MFKPWVGDLYGKKENVFGGKRVLVVGESHHSQENDVGSVVPEMTNEVMQKYAKGLRIRTLDNLAWAVSGKNRQQLENNGQRGEFDVWRSMAFYNYVPVVLARGPRGERPTPALFASGAKPFEDVLSTLRPDLLLVWGYGLFPWMIRNHYSDYPNHPWEFRGDWIDIPGDAPVRAVRMLHPAAAFSPAHWHPIIQAALDSLPQASNDA